MATKGSGMIRGTLDMLVLRMLSANGPLYGYEIAQRIQVANQQVLKVEEGSLYPALHRMEMQGWVIPEWGVAEKNRRVRYYRLAEKGRKQLRDEADAWSRLSVAVTNVMGISRQEA